MFHFSESESVWGDFGEFRPALVLTKFLHRARLHQHSVDWDRLLLLGMFNYLQKVVLFGIGNIVTLDWNLFEVAPVGNRRHLECSRWRWWTACSGRSHRPSPGRPGRGSWCSRCTRSGAPAVQDQDWCWCAGLVGALGWLVRCSHKGCLGGARWLGACLAVRGRIHRRLPAFAQPISNASRKPQIWDICRPLVPWEFFRGVHKSGLNLPRVCQIDLKSHAYCLLLDDFNIVWAVAPDSNKRDILRMKLRESRTAAAVWVASMELPKGVYRQCLSSRLGIIHKRVWFSFNTAGWVKVLRTRKNAGDRKNALACFLVPVLRTVASHPSLEVSSDLILDRWDVFLPAVKLTNGTSEHLLGISWTCIGALEI